jgi:murein DD-endopeptidase MepM/ murein hydrolase activator NlpD
MGDTGRATGANLHFEVLRNGRAVDPLTFIQ